MGVQVRGSDYATWAFGHEEEADVCVRPHPEQGDSANGECVGSAVADGGARGWHVAYDLPFVPSE